MSNCVLLVIYIAEMWLSKLLGCKVIEIKDDYSNAINLLIPSKLTELKSSNEMKVLEKSNYAMDIIHE